MTAHPRPGCGHPRGAGPGPGRTRGGPTAGRGMSWDREEAGWTAGGRAGGERRIANGDEPMSESKPDRWVAPWTDEQVATLNALQDDPQFHSYTCPGDNHRECRTHGRMLSATRDGWVCNCGSYKQRWAHAVVSPLTEAAR